ncbi:MAG: VanZ family protein [Candidatus Omnitrophota bacterium]|nr:VanZ family protein [Candidatus Omnitrophota bacterium]
MTNDKSMLKDWVFLAAYVALIYGTLSIAPNFSKLLSRLLGNDYGLAVNIFVISVVIAAPALFLSKIKTRPLSFYTKLAAVFFLYLFIILRWTEIPAEKIHLVEYGFLSCLVLKVTRGARSHGARYLYTILIVGAIGCGDELIQKCLPNRVCDLKDMALNFISGILGLALIGILNSRRVE